MTNPEAQVRSCLARFVDGADGIDRDVDLIATRTISSLQFMSFIYSVEEQSGRELDLETLPADQLRTISGLAGLYFAGVREVT